MKALALVVALSVILSVPLFSVSQPAGEDVVLVTGFEPFSRWDGNPSGDVALALNGTVVGGIHVVGVVLPVSFNASYARMQEAIERYDPSAVIALGLDGGARMMQVERVAVNLRHPAPLRFGLINVSGPLLRQSLLPVGDIAAAVQREDVAARGSWFAGLYVCNDVFYRLLGDAGQRGMPAGFIHVPPLPSQEPYGMEMAAMLRGVRAAINVTVAA